MKAPLVVVYDGDIISIDISNCRLAMELGEEELHACTQSLIPFSPHIDPGYLLRYAEHASSASKGVIAS